MGIHVKSNLRLYSFLKPLNLCFTTYLKILSLHNNASMDQWCIASLSLEKYFIRPPYDVFASENKYYTVTVLL